MLNKLRKFGEYLQGVTVNNTERVVIAILGLFAFGVALIKPQLLAIILSSFLLIILLVLYFAVLFFSTEILHWVGRKVVITTEVFSRWLFRPKLTFDRKREENGELMLCVKSYSRNEKFISILRCTRVQLLNGTDAEKSAIQYAFGYVDDKRICSENISYGEWNFPITKWFENSTIFVFRNSNNHIRLFPGKYIYTFDGEVKYKNNFFHDFGGELRFSINEKGEIGL